MAIRTLQVLNNTKYKLCYVNQTSGKRFSVSAKSAYQEPNDYIPSSGPTNDPLPHEINRPDWIFREAIKITFEGDLRDVWLYESDDKIFTALSTAQLDGVSSRMIEPKDSEGLVKGNIIIKFDQEAPQSFGDYDSVRMTVYKDDAKDIAEKRDGGFFVSKGILAAIAAIGQILLDWIT